MRILQVKLNSIGVVILVCFIFKGIIPLCLFDMSNYFEYGSAPRGRI